MENFIELVKKASVIHPARHLSFDELQTGLFQEVENGNVNVSYHNLYKNLAIFKYSQNCVMNKSWNVFTVSARGLILDLAAKNVVATPFIKFWNYNEIIPIEKIFDGDFYVTEKLDGSLIIKFYYDNKWMTSTCGSFHSEQAKWAENWINKNIDLDTVDKNNTYLYECIYKENRIVVNYDYEGLVLLSIFDKFGLEYKQEQIYKEANYLGVRSAKIYDFSDMDKIVNDAKFLDYNQEGYVIRFKNNVRVKIKGDEYVRVHRIVSKVTPLSIWEAMLEDTDLEKVRNEIPEEMRKDFDTIREILNNKFDTFKKEVEKVYLDTKNMSDKELGIFISQCPTNWYNLEFPDAIKYVFTVRKNDLDNDIDNKLNNVRRKIFMCFRPKNNVLEDYAPSSFLNRFSEEN